MRPEGKRSISSTEVEQDRDYRFPLYGENEASVHTELSPQGSTLDRTRGGHSMGDT